MKNIKLRIVYLILCSALLLFALFMLAVNLIIPAHFVREAKKALISEAQYQNRTIPYTDDGSFFDDGWNDTEEHFLTPSIVFLELDNANKSSDWNRDAYRLEKKLLEYYKGRDISLNQCYTFKTDRHRTGKKFSREVSIYDPIGADKDGETVSLLDILEAGDREVLETVIIKQDVKILYEAYKENLTDMEQTVIRMRYGLFGTKEHTQREIAEKLGISRSYVSRIEKRAVGHMREAFYEPAGNTR